MLDASAFFIVKSGCVCPVDSVKSCRLRYHTFNIHPIGTKTSIKYMSSKGL